MAAVPATVVADLATGGGAPGESETPETAAYWVPPETYPDLNPTKTGPAPQLFEDILSELRTTIIRNLQHKDPEAVASDAAFLIVNQLFGYDEDVDKTDLWEQLREVINEGQLIKESKYPEFTKDWRLDSLSKYLPGRPKIDDAKWEKVKEALNSVAASYKAVNSAKRGPDQERKFEALFNILESKKAVLEDPSLLLPIYVQYLNVYIFSLRQGISLARRDVPESTEALGLGSVWREAKIQQLDRVINQAHSSAMTIYNKIQEPDQKEIAKQVNGNIPVETQSAVELRFPGQSIISWLTGRPNYGEHYNAWKTWENLWNPRENFLTRYVLDFVDIWKYARTFEPQRVRLTREIFTVAGDPAGTGWLSPFPPKHHEKDLPTSIEIWAGDSNRATDLVDAIQVHYPDGGDDKQDFDRLKPIVLRLIGGSDTPPPPRTANLRIRALDLGSSPIVKVSIRHHKQSVRGTYTDFTQVHRIELVDKNGKVYHAGPRRNSNDTKTEDSRAFSGRVLSSVVALGITDKWFSSIRLGWRLADYA